jgi:WG containing repeat
VSQLVYVLLQCWSAPLDKAQIVESQLLMEMSKKHKMIKPIQWGICFILLSFRCMSQDLGIADWYKEPYLLLDSAGYLGSVLQGGVIQIRNNGKHGLINSDGDFVVGLKGDQGLIRPGLIPVKKDGKLGFLNMSDSLVIPYEYERVTYVSPNHYAIEGTINGFSSCIIVDADGQQIKTPYPIRFRNDTSFEEGLLSAEFWLNQPSNKTGQGYVSLDGEYHLPFHFIYCHHFSRGVAPVTVPYSSERYKYLFIDNKGNVVFECPEEWIHPHSFEGELSLLQIKGKTGFAFIDRSFKLVTEPKYSSYQGYIHGYHRVTDNNKMSLLNDRGETVVDTLFTTIYPLSIDLALVTNTYFRQQHTDLDKLWAYENVYQLTGLYSIEGSKLLIDTKYDWFLSGGEGLYAVKKDDKIGYIDQNEKVIIPFIFEDARGFYNRKAWVKFEGKWGIIQVR